MLLNICMIKLLVIRDMIKHCFGVELYFAIQISSTSFLHQIFRSISTHRKFVQQMTMTFRSYVGCQFVTYPLRFHLQQNREYDASAIVQQIVFYCVSTMCILGRAQKNEPREHWSERFFFYIFRSNINASHMNCFDMELFSHDPFSILKAVVKDQIEHMVL